MQNLFETATREQWRFQTVKGLINVEALWDLKLVSKDDFDLNNVAKTLNSHIKVEAEENFVEPVKEDQTPRLQLELVKYIISVKQKEKTEKEAAKKNSEERQRILEILDRRKDQALETAPEDELRQRLKDLG